ncbi:trans-resveratrol di-O-methyltransferase-like [Papaver somniferum]|uniref:trans-resveratrol di-O-methyltransferase-like n=1 Tax=Papaver somniferum TaxID=3469 RepID=UPI000E6FC43B|nr:trans-resveratrol di-O-methyltransferase-like [Papaver somniferum]
MALSSLVDALSLPSTRTDPLNSLMRFMIHSGFFAKQSLAENQEQQGYVLTTTSRLLVKVNANTMSSVVLSMVDPFMNPGSVKNFHDSMANDSCVLMSVIINEELSVKEDAVQVKTIKWCRITASLSQAVIILTCEIICFLSVSVG